MVLITEQEEEQKSDSLSVAVKKMRAMIEVQTCYWPDLLPDMKDQILLRVGKYESFRAACESIPWRPPVIPYPDHFFPLLFGLEKPANSWLRLYHQDRFFDGFPLHYRVLHMPDFQRIKLTVLGCTYGFLLCGHSTKGFKFMSSVSVKEVYSRFVRHRNSPPFNERFPYSENSYCATIFEYPSDPSSCVLLLTKTKLLCWHWNCVEKDKAWISYPLVFLSDSHKSMTTGFKQLVALSAHRLVAIEAGGHLFLLKVESARKCVTVEAFKHPPSIRSWLVESPDNIMVVSLEERGFGQRLRFILRRYDEDSKSYQMVTDIKSFGSLFVSHSASVPGFFGKPDNWGGRLGVIYFGSHSARRMMFPYKESWPKNYVSAASDSDFWFHACIF